MLSIRHPAGVTLHDCRCVITCAFARCAKGSNELTGKELVCYYGHQVIAYVKWAHICFRLFKDHLFLYKKAP